MPQAPSPARRVLTFGVGGRRYAIDAADVEAVIAAPPITRVPQGPPALQGVANVRGRAAPIVAVARLLDGAAPEAGRTGAGARVIMLAGGAPVGLAVDEINAVQDVDAGQADGAGAELIETADGVLRVLQPRALLAAAFTGSARTRLAARTDTGPAGAEQSREADAAFLQFRLSGQAYAVALDTVREVSRVPAAIQVLPGADAAMLGLIALRERLLPVVSTAAVLGLAAETPGPEARIVVVVIGEAEIGLLVDAVRGVTRTPLDRIAAAPAILNRSAGEARIDSILRTDAGLVSILAAERVLDDATVARLLAEGMGRAQTTEAGQAVGEAMQRFVIFRLGDEVYGLPIGDIEAVIRLPDSVTRVPGAPAFVAGVINHRGHVTPLVDQAMRFSTPGASDAARRRVIVTRLDGLTAGFIVDAVDQVASIPESALQAAPELAAGEAGVFDRVASVEHGGGLVLLVDPRQLLDQAERDILRALAADTDARPAP